MTSASDIRRSFRTAQRKRAGKLIREERDRQKAIEGWSEEHDDAHDDGELLLAARCYFDHATFANAGAARRADGVPMGWPWDAASWKPKTPVRDLVRAGALVLAEIDRLHRAKRYISTNHAAKLYSRYREVLADLLEKESAHA